MERKQKEHDEKLAAAKAAHEAQMEAEQLEDDRLLKEAEEKNQAFQDEYDLMVEQKKQLAEQEYAKIEAAKEDAKKAAEEKEVELAAQWAKILEDQMLSLQEMKDAHEEKVKLAKEEFQK